MNPWNVIGWMIVVVLGAGALFIPLAMLWAWWVVSRARRARSTSFASAARRQPTATDRIRARSGGGARGGIQPSEERA